MSALVASSSSAHPLRGTLRPAPPIRRSPDDRWLSVKNRQRASALMSFILAASMATHAGLVATAFWADWRQRDPPPKEISVEVIQETAKPPTPKPPPPTPKQAATPQQSSSAAKPEPAKPQLPKPESAKRDETKTAQKASQPAKPEPKAQTQKASARKAAAEPNKQPTHSAQHASEADALRKQLQSLKAEQAALNAQRESLKPTPASIAEPAKAGPSGSERFRNLLGESPLSMGAVALPGESANGTEAVSYKQLVLSKVAKAKKEGSYPGRPGYATIAFLIGDKGEVASSKIERAMGDPSISQEATDMIARGAPYPVPPPGAQRMFVVTLEFRPAS